jgi:type IX secretion system PorP/SprF family membrane protein
MRTKLFLLTAIVLSSASELLAQDIHFSQFYMTPVQFNPSYAGALKELDVSMQYKGQWNMIDKGYRTLGATVSSRINYKRGNPNFWSIGLTAFADQAAINKLNSLRINIPLCYTVKLNQMNSLSNAVYVGFGQNVLKDPNLTWGSQFDGMNYNSALPTNETQFAQSFRFLDMGYGFSWNHNQQTRTVADEKGFSNSLGFSVGHLNRPMYSFNNNPIDKLDMKFSLYNSSSIYIKNSKISWHPSVLVQLQGGHREIIYGALCRYEIQQESRITGFREGSAISAGMYRRSKDAIVIAGLYEINHFQIGMSYDMNTSALSNSTGYRGGFEILLKYITPSPFSGGGRSIF